MKQLLLLLCFTLSACTGARLSHDEARKKIAAVAAYKSEDLPTLRNREAEVRVSTESSDARRAQFMVPVVSRRADA